MLHFPCFTITGCSEDAWMCLLRQMSVFLGHILDCLVLRYVFICISNFTKGCQIAPPGGLSINIFTLCILVFHFPRPHLVIRCWMLVVMG